MDRAHLYRVLTAVVVAASLGERGTLTARAQPESDGQVVAQETDLVANAPDLLDRNGIVHHAFLLDPHLVNPWGIAEAPTSPFWVADNDTGASTLYRLAGGSLSIVPSVFTLPGPGDPLNRTGKPTGSVFNTDAGGQGFKVAGVDRNHVPAAAPALFLFATEDGTIVGWNPGINPEGFDSNLAGTYAIVAVDNSANP